MRRAAGRVDGYANAVSGQRRAAPEGQAAWVAERRRMGAGWAAIAAMLGCSVDAVRRAYDPDYDRP